MKEDGNNSQFGYLGDKNVPFYLLVPRLIFRRKNLRTFLQWLLTVMLSVHRYHLLSHIVARSRGFVRGGGGRLGQVKTGKGS